MVQREYPLTIIEKAGEYSFDELFQMGAIDETGKKFLNENKCFEEDQVLICQFETTPLNQYDELRRGFLGNRGKEVSKYIFQFDTLQDVWDSRDRMRVSHPQFFHAFGTPTTVFTNLLTSFVEKKKCYASKFKFFEL